MTEETVYTALLKLQGELRGVRKDAANSHFRNRYATLEAVTDTIRPHMQGLGLLWIQSGGAINDGAMAVTTRIHHPASNTFHEATMEMPLGKKDPQGAGSAMTYAMRYSLMAMLGLPPTDDDAETAIDRKNDRPEPDKPDEEKAKSSAALKREGVWDKAMADLRADFDDCHSRVALEKLKSIYRERARREGWNRPFLEQLAEEFAKQDEALERAQYMMAGE